MTTESTKHFLYPSKHLIKLRKTRILNPKPQSYSSHHNHHILNNQQKISPYPTAKTLSPGCMPHMHGRKRNTKTSLPLPMQRKKTEKTHKTKGQ
jgi:hypothetical protein